MNNPLPVSDLNEHIGPVMQALAQMGWQAAPGWITAHAKIGNSVYGIQATTVKADPEGPVTSIRWDDTGGAGTLFIDTGELLAKDIAPIIINAMHRNIVDGTLGVIEDPVLKSLYTAMLPSMDVKNTAANPLLTEPPSLRHVQDMLNEAREHVRAYELGLSNPIDLNGTESIHDAHPKQAELADQHDIDSVSLRASLWSGMADQSSHSWPPEQKEQIGLVHLKESILSKYMITKGVCPYDYNANEMIITVQGGETRALPMPLREAYHTINSLADALASHIHPPASKPALDPQHLASKLASLDTSLETPSAKAQGPRL